MGDYAIISKSLRTYHIKFSFYLINIFNPTLYISFSISLAHVTAETIVLESLTFISGSKNKISPFLRGKSVIIPRPLSLMSTVTPSQVMSVDFSKLWWYGKYLIT